MTVTHAEMEIDPTIHIPVEFILKLGAIYHYLNHSRLRTPLRKIERKKIYQVGFFLWYALLVVSLHKVFLPMTVQMVMEIMHAKGLPFKQCPQAPHFCSGFTLPLWTAPAGGAGKITS